MGVSPLTNNAAKTSVGEDLAKIRSAVAEQSHQKIKKNTERALKHKTSPSFRSERRPPSS